MDSSTRRKVAVFVDFDNAFSGLRERSPAAAEAFGSGPRTWLRWLEEGMPSSFAQGGLLQRAILVRKCYLNPGMYGRYRQCFAEAGFQVTDCPPLTGNGKTSADMLMVLEIMDALQRRLYDEFIIFSGDADFTPVLLRLRAHDHRTAVIVTGNYARVMHGAADVLIESEIFMRFALKIVPEAPSAAVRAAEPPARRAGAAPETAPRPAASATRASAASSPAPVAHRADKPENAASAGASTTEEARIMDFLRSCLAEARQPLSLSHLGERVRAEFKSVGQTGWFGRGGFGKWLRSQRNLPFTVFTKNGGAYIRDRNASDSAPAEASAPATPGPQTTGTLPAPPESGSRPPLRGPAESRAPESQDVVDEIAAASAHPHLEPEEAAEGDAPQAWRSPDPRASGGDAPSPAISEPEPASAEAGTGPAHFHAPPGPPATDVQAVETTHDQPETTVAEVHLPMIVDDAPPPAAAEPQAHPEPATLDADRAEVIRVEPLFPDSIEATDIDVPAEPRSAAADSPGSVAFNGEEHVPLPFLDWSPLFPDQQSAAKSRGEAQHPITEETAPAAEVERAACGACGAALRPGHPCCMACGTPT